MKFRHNKPALVTLAVGVPLCFVLVWAGPSLWEAMTVVWVKIDGVHDGHPWEAWEKRPQPFFSKVPLDQILTAYYVENEYKFRETVIFDGGPCRETVWGFDGKVQKQGRSVHDKLGPYPWGTNKWPAGGYQWEVKTSPPWWWGVQDQTGPAERPR